MTVKVDNTIHKEFQLFRGKFASLFCKIKQAILDSSITMDKLKDFILFYYPDLEQDVDTHDFFLVLRRVCSPTNCEFLESMADHFNLFHVNELIADYMKEEDIYKSKLLNQKFVQELQEELAVFRPELETQISVKLQWRRANETTVEEFRDILQEISPDYNEIHTPLGCSSGVCPLYV